jgi:hypothetical protein
LAIKPWIGCLELKDFAIVYDNVRALCCGEPYFKENPTYIFITTLSLFLK